MTVGRNVKRGQHANGFIQDISEASSNTDDVFFTWFDDALDKDDAFERGNSDFKLHISDPIDKFTSHMNQRELIALDIGYGGGRLLAAACNKFAYVHGIDLHRETDRVSDELHQRGITNFSLFKTDGKSIPLKNTSIDIAYSFIVFQHVEFIHIFNNYIKELARVLKHGGVAVIYFGRFKLFSYRRSSKLLLLLDRMLENFYLRKGYLEIEANVNCNNLIISTKYAIRTCQAHNLSIEKILVSYRKSDDGKRVFGGQNGLILKRVG